MCDSSSGGPSAVDLGVQILELNNRLAIACWEREVCVEEGGWGGGGGGGGGRWRGAGVCDSISLNSFCC